MEIHAMSHLADVLRSSDKVSEGWGFSPGTKKRENVSSYLQKGKL